MWLIYFKQNAIKYGWLKFKYLCVKIKFLF